MGAAATVSKDDEEIAQSQKQPTSFKSQGRNRNSAMVVCSGCKTPLNIFKRKVVCLFFIIS